MKILAFLPNKSNLSLPNNSSTLSSIPSIPSPVSPLAPILSFPDSAIVKNGNPIFLPDFDSRFIGSFFLAVKISRLGKSIAERFASRYYSEVAPAMNIVAKGVLDSLSANGLPWTAATGFDRSLAVGNFIDYPLLSAIGELNVVSSDGNHDTLTVPSPEVIAKAIHMASRYNSLKMGDLILIPLSKDSIDLKIDSMIAISAGDDTLLKIPVK